MSISKAFVKRTIISMLAGLLLGAIISEVSFVFLRETARAPQVIELVIPEGTAARVARGEAPPTIPEQMTFVVGDKLVVKNDDGADHELGPLWIPAGSSASLSLDSVQSYAYTCSFSASKYLGLDVREALTLKTRFSGILYSGIPLGALIAVYAAILPTRKREAKAEK